jgi:hypothetical protein
MGNLYDIDIVAWAEQQAELLRAGRFSELDVENVAEEIEDVGRREKRELESRLAVLIAHLLKWQLQPSRRGGSWRGTIKTQRVRIERILRQMPSLKHTLKDQDFFTDAWLEGVGIVFNQTRLVDVPLTPIWSLSQVLEPGFVPH